MLHKESKPKLFIDDSSSSSSSSEAFGSAVTSFPPGRKYAYNENTAGPPFLKVPFRVGGSQLSSASLPDTEHTTKKSQLSDHRRFSVFPFPIFNRGSAKFSSQIMAAETSRNDGTDVEATELISTNDPLKRLQTGESVKSLPFEDFRTQISRAPQPVFSQLAQYMGGIHPSGQGGDAQEQKKAAPARLGTFLGVFLPCIQNIFGIMMFARMAWLTGNSGLVESLIIAIMCCATTFLTSISISALATNGRVPGGGAYYVISRTLGPELGGSVGFLFFLGNVAGCAMYITGGIEILIMYLAPQIAIPYFGPITEPSSLYNHCRLYGTIALIVVFAVVSIGIRFVAITGFVTLTAVVGTILLVFIGMFTTDESNSKLVCFVGSRLWRMDRVYFNNTWCCVKDKKCPSPIQHIPNPLYQYYCGSERNASDPVLCNYFKNKNTKVSAEPGIPGLWSGVIMENLWPAYATGEGEIPGSHLLEKNTIAKNPSLLYGNRQAGEIVTDISTSFLIIIGIFFPSATGVLAGSNRSGDLANPGKAIPLGTIGAQVLTTICYLSWIVIFAATMKGQVLRDKLGESMTTASGGSLMAGNIAWPNPMVAQIGSFLATMGAALQSLTSAPRLLNALAKDDVIPFLKPFAYVTRRGEPIYAQLLSAGIAWLGILLGTIDLIGPVVTMFFLICYAGVNASCCINSLLHTPNWRPRFRFYHWSLSGFGVLLAVVIMFLSNWWQALIALVLGSGIYKYIEYKGAQKDWGDGVRGVQMSAALAAVQRLPVDDKNVKSYRPQLLLFVKPEEDPATKKLVPQKIAANLFAFARQLKAGKGLVVVGSVIEGGYVEKAPLASGFKAYLLKQKDIAKLKALPSIVVSPSAEVGMATLCQSTGIGALRPNTVLIAWPQSWKDLNISDGRVHLLPNLLRAATAADLSAIVMRNADVFPENSKTDRMMGTTDLWWIVEDSGVLLMIPYILQQHRVWERSKFRIFMVTWPDKGVDANQVQKAMTEFVYDLRLTATVDVIAVDEHDIAPCIYQKTLTCEDRGKLMGDLQSQRQASTSAPSSSGKSSSLMSPEQAKEIVAKSSASRTLASKLNSAHSLNQLMLSRSKEADLVIVSMPKQPKHPNGDLKFMEYVDILTEGFSRVLLIRGSQKCPVVSTKFAED